jgi:hypothetical protein
MVKIITVPPLVGTSTNVGRIAPSPGIYGSRVAGTPPINAVKVRGKRAPKGRGTI